MNNIRTDVLNFINSISRSELRRNSKLISVLSNLRFYLDEYSKDSFLKNERKEMLKYLNKNLI